jgi:hypothetical protein
MAINLTPHSYVKGRAGASKVDYRNANHYLRLTKKDCAVLYIQRGRIQTEDGDVIPFEDLEPWAVEEIMKCTPEALRAVGFTNESVLKQIDAARKAKVTRAKAVKISARKEDTKVKPAAKPKPPAKRVAPSADLDDELPALDGESTDTDAPEDDIS